MKDYTECILVEFDPSKVTYEDLLVEFSRLHSPHARRKTQYRSLILYANEEQRDLAEEFLDGLKAGTMRNESVQTDLEPFTKFFMGEEYHQNYLAKATGKTKF